MEEKTREVEEKTREVEEKTREIQVSMHLELITIVKFVFQLKDEHIATKDREILNKTDQIQQQLNEMQTLRTQMEVQYVQYVPSHNLIHKSAIHHSHHLTMS